MHRLKFFTEKFQTNPYSFTLHFKSLRLLPSSYSSSIENMPSDIESAEDFASTLEAAKKDGKVIIAKFGAEWCGPCKLIAPYYAELEGKYSDMIFLEITYDKEDNEDIVDEYKILKLPTFVVIKDGKEAERYQGADQDKLKELVSKQFKDAVQNAFSMDEDF